MGFLAAGTAAGASTANSAWIGPAIAAAGQTGNAMITKGSPRRQYKYNKRMAEEANVRNRENQQWLLEQNKALLEEQRAYDSPAAQMARFKAAGLNPHLIYGQATGGSSPISAGSMPAYDMGRVDASIPPMLPDFMQLARSQAGIDLTQSRIAESTVKQELMQLEQLVKKANPLLDEETLAAVRTGLMATAAIKDQEKRFLYDQTPSDQRSTPGFVKMQADFNSIMLKNGLLSAQQDNVVKDSEIKSQILRSEQFNADLKELQTKWLKDGQIHSDHILTFVKMLFQSMLNNK